MARPNIEFLCIAEAGTLEEEALLLCQSIREFGGRYSNALITVLQPRPHHPVSATGRTRFASLDARVVELNITSPCPEYGPSFRVGACAEYERRARGEILVFMDSDTLLLAEPDLELQGHDVATRPVDVQGICTLGATDSRDAYWRELCAVCGVDYDRVPQIESFVDRMPVKASHNGGLLVTRRKAGLFARTAEFFLRANRAGLVVNPDATTGFQAGYGPVSSEGCRHWGSSQACASLAMTALGLRVRILPPSVNFPLHSYAALAGRIADGEIPLVAHVHYHQLLRRPACENPILSGCPGFPEGAAAWLNQNAGRVCRHTEPRAVMVVGMHRSGTSILSKSLEVLGVNLGSDFHPARPDNPKGDWEDRNFHQLNEEMLSQLGHPWDDEEEIDPESIHAFCNGPCFDRALALVANRLSKSPVIGIKDPRFALLLPFWKRVFHSARVPVSYVFAVRNPLSVHDSLHRRNGFSKTKSFRLWSLYNARIASEILREPSVFVDYDQLIANPVEQLARIARWLDLPLDNEALAAFLSREMDRSLQHSRFSVADLAADPDCPPDILALYTELHSQALAFAIPDRTNLLKMAGDCDEPSHAPPGQEVSWTGPQKGNDFPLLLTAAFQALKRLLTPADSRTK